MIEENERASDDPEGDGARTSRSFNDAEDAKRRVALARRAREEKSAGYRRLIDDALTRAQAKEGSK